MGSDIPAKNECALFQVQGLMVLPGLLCLVIEFFKGDFAFLSSPDSCTVLLLILLINLILILKIMIAILITLLLINILCNVRCIYVLRTTIAHK